MANIWRGEFPARATVGAGGTPPVRSYTGNGYGLNDMIGNVWQWTADSWSLHPSPAVLKACCVPSRPGGAAPIRRKVLKGVY